MRGGCSSRSKRGWHAARLGVSERPKRLSIGQLARSFYAEAIHRAKSADGETKVRSQLATLSAVLSERDDASSFPRRCRKTTQPTGEAGLQRNTDSALLTFLGTAFEWAQRKGIVLGNRLVDSANRAQNIRWSI